jgi:NhaA family Na+:H+ antiporter
MIFPAAIYLLIVPQDDMANGWGIPMATDIAFALVLLRVLRERVPLAIQVFLAALAVADDLGAILVIAIFYTDTIVYGALIIAFSAFLLLLIANRLGIRSPGFYAAVGIFGIWLAILQSGVHATIAGVLIAMAIPANKLVRDRNFPKRVKKLGQSFDDKHSTEDELVTDIQLELLHRVNKLALSTAPPLQRIERKLSPFVSYIVLPLFALSNAGVRFSSNWQEAVFSPVSLGIIAGLILGKTIGILSMVKIVTWLDLAELPRSIGWNHLLGASCFAGIGFTMSLFIAQLAFDSSSRIQSAKMGILIASTISALIGLTVFLQTSSTAFKDDENSKSESH